MALARWQLQRLFTEGPAYEVERKLEHGIEIRRYAPCVRAETTVEAPTWGEAVSIGFRRLAGYIFGGNRPHQTIAMTAPVTVAGERIAMTAPVTVAGERIAMTAPVTVAGERIAMTAPVTVAGEPSRPGVSPSASWTITFTLPKGRDLASLPRPDDANVTLRDVPARRVAALRFAGRFKRPQIDARGRELVASLARAGVTTRGSIEAAGYDPPGVLPFLRRNEVWVELAD